MTCKQDAVLLELGIAVDLFSVEAKIFCLSHPHFDHMIGLKSNFREKKNAKIIATRITTDLAKLTISGLTDDDFIVVTYNEPFHPVNNVTAYAFPSYHCDGSCMFLFEINDNPLLRIMYTSDFRFRPEIRDNDILGDFVVHRLYIDDTFDEIESHYPTYEDTISQIIQQIKYLREKGFVKINIHASILGLEPILREVSTKLQTKFGLLHSMKDTWRGKQMKYLLEDKLDVKNLHSINLGNHKHSTHEKSSGVPWIIPTCTYFLCDKLHRKTKKPDHHFYVFFCAHSNRIENNQMKLLISAKETISCGAVINKGKLKCNQ